MIAVIDYEMGNLRSVEKALERVGASAVITRDPDVIASAAAAVLPGVGAFGTCMDNLRKHRLIDPVQEFVASGRPFLGICLGMQLLFDESDEFGPVRGLGILPGRVVRFAPDPAGQRKVPHMGWNGIAIRRRPPHLAGLSDGTQVYFVHSYYPVPDDPGVVATTTEYGGDFVSPVGHENVFASQVPPQKSQTAGLRILANFAALAGETDAARADTGA
jgi:glutamine amidotransferase